ncbi:hypothetical protein QE152_g774 [Popillia japonica]|uniref:Uncharacterized protein n=1 Tax=Popillia japonica TaxID=7064 RepID=A0AAW1NAA0_POPJA
MEIGNILKSLNVKQVWTNLSPSRKLSESIEKTYVIVRTYQIAIVIITILAMHVMFAKPVLEKDAVFLIETWVFIESLRLETFVLFCEYYVYLIVIAVVIGFDLIYLCICVDVVIRVKLIKERLQDRHLDVNERKRFGTIIHSHLLLLT